MRFKDKVAIITGAASGIGRAAANGFAREGAAVVIVDIDPVAGAEAVKEIRHQGAEAIFSLTDVSDESQVKAMVDAALAKYHKIDILVNNAGIYHQANVVDTPLEIWSKVMAVNLTGAFLCTKHAAAAMIQQKSGVIINVASEAGLVGIKEAGDLQCIQRRYDPAHTELCSRPRRPGDPRQLRLSGDDGNAIGESCGEPGGRSGSCAARPGDSPPAESPGHAR